MIRFGLRLISRGADPWSTGLKWPTYGIRQRKKNDTLSTPPTPSSSQSPRPPSHQEYLFGEPSAKAAAVLSRASAASARHCAPTREPFSHCRLIAACGGFLNLYAIYSGFFAGPRELLGIPRIPWGPGENISTGFSWFEPSMFFPRRAM